MQITYRNKVTLQSATSVPDENKVTANDMNEIKSVVNSNEEEQQALIVSVQNNTENISSNKEEITSIKEEQAEQNEDISKLQTNVTQNNTDIEQIKTEQINQNISIQTNATDISNIKAEQTEQNNKLANLETDNTTNKTNIANNTTEINNIKAEQISQNTAIGNKVSKVNGKGLSTNDYTTEEKNKLAGLSNYDDTDIKDDILDIQEEQIEQNTNISNNTTNIETLEAENEDLKEQLKDKENNELKGIMSGTSIDLSDSADSRVVEFGVKGNSIQDGEPGPIYSAGDNGSITEKIINKNFWKKSEIIWRRNNNVNFDLSNADANTTRIRTSSFLIKGGKTYIISGYPSTVSIVSVGCFNKNKERITGQITRNGNVFTITSEVAYIYFLFGGENFTSETNIMMENANIQLEEGSIATSYEEYKEQTYTIPAQQSMKSIGDVRDEFVAENNSLIERHHIYRYIFTGEETFQLRDYGNNTVNSEIALFSFNLPFTYDVSKTPSTMCNSFISLGIVSGWSLMRNKDVGIALYNSNAKTCYINTTEATTVADFKAYLAERYANDNPVYIDYDLEEPQDLSCTPEQIIALQAFIKARTYKNVTHIYSTDETPARIDGTYVKDLETYLDNRFSEIENAMTALGGV